TKAGELNAWLVGSKENRTQYGKLGEEVKALKSRCAVYASGLSREERAEQLRDLIAATKVIWELAKEVAARYEQKKENVGALDFDDLQIRAVELLREPGIRRE